MSVKPNLENIKFFSKNYTFSRVNGKLEPFKMSAKYVNKRERSGRILKFIDQDELYFNGLIIDQPIDQSAIELDVSTDNYGNSKSADHLIKNQPYSGFGNTISRVLVDDIKINFKPADHHTFYLKANHAKMLTDAMVIQFEENVMLNADACKIISDLAIWSNEYSGLYFPGRHVLNDKTYVTPAFYHITDSGKCQQSLDVKSIKYVDPLDRIEDNLMESMPMEVRLLFGLF